jgi:hypothetical protein
LTLAINPDDVRRIRAAIDKNRTELTPDSPVEEYLKFGMYELILDTINSPESDPEFARELKLKYALFTNDYSQFLAQYKGLDIKPGDSLYWLVAKFYQETEDYVKAAALISEIDEGRQSGKERYSYISSLIHLGNYAEVKKLIKKYREDYPLDERVTFLEAKYEISQGDFHRAIRFLRIYLENHPFDADARFLYAYSMWNQQNPRNWKKVKDQLELIIYQNPYHYRSNYFQFLINSARNHLYNTQTPPSQAKLIVDTRNRQMARIYCPEQEQDGNYASNIEKRMTRYGNLNQYFEIFKGSDIQEFIKEQTRIDEKDEFSELDLALTRPDRIQVKKTRFFTENLPLALCDISNPFLFDILDKTIRQVFTYDEFRELRNIYLQVQFSDLNKCYLGQNETELLFNAFCSYFNIKGGLYQFTPEYEKDTLKKNLPGLYDFIEKTFENKTEEEFKANSDRFFLHQIQSALAGGNLTWARDRVEKIDANELKTSIPLAEAKARALIGENRLDEAEQLCLKILTRNPEYTHAYLLLTDIESIKSDGAEPVSINQQIIYLEEAVTNESDPAIALSLSVRLFNMYLQNAEYVNALKISEQYFHPLHQVSGNLYPEQHPELYASWLRGIMGYSKDSFEYLEKLVEDHPYDIELKLLYAKMLEVNQKYTKVIQLLESSQRRLSAFQLLDNDYMLTIAENYLLLGDSVSAFYAMEPILNQDDLKEIDSLKFATVLA